MKLFSIDMRGTVVRYNEVTAIDDLVVPLSFDNERFPGIYDIAQHGRFPQSLDDLLVTETKMLRFVVRVVESDEYYVISSDSARKFVNGELIPVSVSEVIPHLNRTRTYPFVVDYYEKLISILDLLVFIEKTGLPADLAAAVLD